MAIKRNDSGPTISSNQEKFVFRDNPMHSVKKPTATRITPATKKVPTTQKTKTSKSTNNPNIDSAPEVLQLGSLEVEGLEKEREKFRATILDENIPLEKYADAVKEATKEYTTSIETALNQPIEVVLQNANVTNINDITIAYRDAGAQATERMKEGATGKTLTEKPKSSKHGIALAGYIPIDQSFGKAGDSGQSDRFNKIVDERFAKGKLYADTLSEMSSHLNESGSKSTPSANTVMKDKEGRELHVLVDDKGKNIVDNHNMPMFAYKDNQGQYHNKVGNQEVNIPDKASFKKLQLQDVLEHNPVAKTIVKDKENREIYGVVNDKGQALKDDKGKPTFAYKNDKGEYCNEVDGAVLQVQDQKSFKKMEALSYISGISKNEAGEFQLTTQKITGDHDQLAIGTKGVRGDKIDDKEISSTKGFADDHGLAATVALIDETKKTGAVRHGQDAGGAGTKGSLSQEDLGNITKVTQQENASISNFLDNPEIKKLRDTKLSGNPYPEDFAKGNYAFYQPEGKIAIAHDEAGIVEKYNDAEAKGYNMGINPKYGWQRNEEGKLEIDPNKISAQSFIMSNTANQEAILKGPTFDHLSPDDRAIKAQAAKNDADKMYELSSIVSLIKLQEDSPERTEALKTSQKMLRRAEGSYAKEYGMLAPTVEAIVDKKQQLEVMKETLSIQKEDHLQTTKDEKKPLKRRNSDPNLETETKKNPPIIKRSNSSRELRTEDKSEPKKENILSKARAFSSRMKDRFMGKSSNTPSIQSNTMISSKKMQENKEAKKAAK